MTIVMAPIKQVNVSEFKAVCLRLLEEVRRTGQPIEILKNGKPLAIVNPVPSVSRKNTFGCLKHTVTGSQGDLISPVVAADEWEVLR